MNSPQTLVRLRCALQEQKALGVPFVLAWDRALRELGTGTKHWQDPLMATRATLKHTSDGAGEPETKALEDTHESADPGPQSSD